jgi:hypothetical protein
MQCKEWDDANSELFKESHDEAVHKISYESELYELISVSLDSYEILNGTPIEAASRLRFRGFRGLWYRRLWQRKPNNLALLEEMHPYPRLRRYFS